MKKNIYLYSDEGAGNFSLHGTQSYFEKIGNVTRVKAEDIIQNGIPQNIDMLVMPGGADRPYVNKLNGRGNDNIRSYVENGGTYIGICAGAYYACQQIEWKKDLSGEICEGRELYFFKGTGVGFIKDICNDYDDTLNTAAITQIELKDQTYNVLYWGGCYFKANDNADFEIIATYKNVTNQPPAIVSCAVGKGRAILSGVHFEGTVDSIRQCDFKNKSENDLKINLSKQLNNNISEIIKEYLYD